MNGFEQSLLNLIAWVQPITYILVAVAIALNGVLCMIGGEEGREKAKKALPWVAIGGILLIGAVVIAKEFVSAVAF